MWPSLTVSWGEACDPQTAEPTRVPSTPPPFPPHHPTQLLARTLPVEPGPVCSRRGRVRCMCQVGTRPPIPGRAAVGCQVRCPKPGSLALEPGGSGGMTLRTPRRTSYFISAPRALVRLDPRSTETKHLPTCGHKADVCSCVGVCTQWWEGLRR